MLKLKRFCIGGLVIIMPVKGIARVKRNYRRIVKDIAGRQTEAAVTEILSQGVAFAQTMTPVDTGNLAQSQYHPSVEINGSKAIGRVGYIAEYAGWVHGKPGTLDGQPRANGNGSYWDTAGEPEFLRKGFDEVKPSIPQILKKHYD